MLLACTASAVFSLASVAHGQSATASSTTATTTDGSTVLNKIVVSGKGKRVGTVADTPLATETTRDEIAKKEIDDLDDLGNTTEPGVSFVEATKSVNIRGLEDDRVLTTIDGIPIPYIADSVWSAYGGNDSYDFSSLSTVDILRGGDSSRAGSGALGGAVILRTLEPEDLIGEGKTWGGIAKGSYDSSDSSYGGSVAAAKRIENTSILFQGSYKKGHEDKTEGDVNSYGTTRTEANPEDYDKNNLLVKLRQQLEGGHMIGLTAERYRSNSTTNLRQTQGSTYLADDYEQAADTARDRVSADYRFDAIGDDSLISSAWTSIYWQKLARTEGNSGTRLTNPKGTYSRISDSEERSIGMVGSATGNYQTGALSHEVTVGADVSLFSTSQYITGADSCATTYIAACAYYHTNQSDTPDMDGKRVGIYIDDKIEFGSSNVSLTPGARFDWYDYDTQATAGYEANSGYDGLPAGVSDARISPKVRLAWQAQPDVELYAQFATGFKAPNVTQLYSNYDNSPLYRQVGNPDLKSETSLGFEVGANLGDENLGAKLSGFYNNYKNFIDTETVAETGYLLGTYRAYNIDRVRIYGVEVKGHMNFDNGFNLRASLAYAKGEDLETGDSIASVAPLKAIVGFGYAKENWGADLNWVGVDRVSDKSTAAFKAPGYGLFNLAGWWEPEQTKGLRIQAGIYNLFDKEYYDALEVKDLSITSSASNRAFYSESGRTFKISLTQKF
jgi:hemoglobin/transferrin/lactoferrin receptor protein